jgi:hypothetical protein
MEWIGSTLCLVQGSSTSFCAYDSAARTLDSFRIALVLMLRWMTTSGCGNLAFSNW